MLTAEITVQNIEIMVHSIGDTRLTVEITVPNIVDARLTAQITVSDIVFARRIDV